MFWFSPCIFCLRWLSWTDVQVSFSSLLLVLEYEDCANQTSCADMPLDAYYTVLLPVNNLSIVWSSKVPTLALTNSLGCGFGDSTRSWGLPSLCNCKGWASGSFFIPTLFSKRHHLGTHTYQYFSSHFYSVKICDGSNGVGRYCVVTA